MQCAERGIGMSDKELLELAAKAAGIGPVLCYETRRNCLRIGTRDKYELWRPLTDDGDALRLAVELNIDITMYPAIQEVGAVQWHHNGVCGGD